MQYTTLLISLLGASTTLASALPAADANPQPFWEEIKEKLHVAAAFLPDINLGDQNTPLKQGEMWCNAGWGGDGECEALRGNTFCCNTIQGDPFVSKKIVGFAGNVANGEGRCLTDGYILCGRSP